MVRDFVLGKAHSLVATMFHLLVLGMVLLGMVSLGLILLRMVLLNEDRQPKGLRRHRDRCSAYGQSK